MAKHRKKQQWKQNKVDILKVPAAGVKAKGNEKDRYAIAIKDGRAVEEYIIKKGQNVLPKRSIGRSKSMQQLKEIYNYYSREEIQKEMFKYAAGRKITYLRMFKPQFEFIKQSEDVLPLSLYTLFWGKGNYWPSLHGTISKYGSEGNRICDIVIEIDYKSSWESCFEMTRPVIEWLKNIGAVFKIKFSGHCSPHIIIPAEAFPEQINGKYMFPGQHSHFFRSLTEIVKSKIKQPRYLDTSFHLQEHFLRLAYSLNEMTGLVSLPIAVHQFDYFQPFDAKPSIVKPLNGWWSIPQDAPQRMEEFINAVLHQRVIVSKKRAEIPRADEHVEFAHPRKKRKPLLIPESLLTNEAMYEQMVTVGQDRIDLRDFLLLEVRDIKDALRMLRRFQENGNTVNIPKVAKLHGVDEEDLKFSWDWEKNERIFRYYGSDEIRQAIYELTKSRKIRVGLEQRAVALREPMDVLPLAVYAHFDARQRTKYPGFYCTASKFNPDGRVPISCDVYIQFTTKDSQESPFEAAQPVVAMLSGTGITFFMYYDGKSGPNIIIPYEAFPQVGNWAIARHETMVEQLSKYLKSFMRMPGATCRLAKEPHTFLPIPYSVHPETGLAHIPIIHSEMHEFSPKAAWLGKVEVDNEWWNVPPDAQRKTERFLKDVILEPLG
ncbi:hypothetical protein H8E77_35665 [bacterium]|nr:hypothetical protein [bacterium]